MTKKNIITKMENTNLLTKTAYTQEEYRNQLLSFQKMVAEMVMGETEDYVRYEDIRSQLERKGKEKNLLGNPEFRKGLEALNKMGKETAIIISGNNGEGRIHKTLTYLERKNALFQNVFIESDLETTEIDEIVLTESGLVVLEIKSIKDDLTINEDGQLLYGNTTLYHDYSICEKMDRKRRLLTSLLEGKLQEQGLNIPVKVNSYIVFVTPKQTRYQVNDLCRKERFCFSSNVGKIIENYGLGKLYDEESMNALKEILSNQETMKKTFTVKLPMDEIREDIAGALALVNEESAKESNPDYDQIYRQTRTATKSSKHKYTPIPVNVAAIVIAMIYMISPLDAMIGPLDDTAVMMIAAVIVIVNQIISSAVNGQNQNIKVQTA